MLKPDEGAAIRDLCIHQLFSRRASKSPDRTALIFQGGRMTYGELAARSSQVARRLVELGVGPEVCVGLCCERSPHMLVGLLGILKAGGAYVPLDPEYPGERLAWMLRNAEGPVLVSTSAVLDRLPGLAAAAEHVLSLDGDRADLDLRDTADPEVMVGPRSMAYVIYTSGTTGTPKGVVIEHRALAAYVETASGLFGMTSQDRTLQFASLSFDASAEEIFCSLGSGAALALRTEDMLGSVDRFCAQCREWGLTTLHLPTAYWHLLAEELEADQLPETIRLVVIGGEQAREDALERWRTVVGSGVRLLNAYGPTETTISVAIADLTRGDPASGVPIGKPLPGVDAHVLDSNRIPVPEGSTGELHVGGVQLARGYLGRQDLTAKSFIPDPFSHPRNRLYATGDLVRLESDGTMYFTGRVDQQVKLRGFRIELGEVESVLRQHQAVREAVAVLREDSSGDKRLVAYAVVDQGAVSARELEEFLASRLPPHARPSAVMTLPSLPLTPQGKIDRRALPAPASRDQAGKEDEPATATERKLARIWFQVLGVDDVGRRDDFFALGGHSLLMFKVMARVGKAFGVDLPREAAFSDPTLAGMAGRIDETMGRMADLPVVEPDRPLPLAPDQKTLWLFEQFHPGTTAYHLPKAYRVQGRLDLDALARSLTELALRHESLRTVFRLEDAKPVQVILAPQDVVLEVEEAEGRERDDAWMADWLRRAVRTPFDLEKGPLFRAAILRFGPEDHVFFLMAHHIASDGWSEGVMIREINALYAAHASGRTLVLPDLPAQYRHFTAWRRQRALAARGTSLAYWKKKLAPPLPRIAWPAMLEQDGKGRGFAGARQPISLEGETGQRLMALPRRIGIGGATTFHVLLAVFKAMLQRLANLEEVAATVVTAGRDRVEFEPLIGFCINTLVLRTGLAGNPSFSKLVERVRDVAVEAMAHGDTPFSELSEAVLQADAREAPVQVMFLMQNMELPPLALSGTRSLEVSIDPGRSNMDLTLELYETDEGFRGWFEYSTDLFQPAQARRMALFFEAVAAAVASDPDRRLDMLPVLDVAEPVPLLPLRDRYPLSPMQMGMLLDTLRAPAGSGVYIEQVACRLSERLEVKPFLDAWRKTVAQHSAMRTAFRWQDLPEPEQVVTSRVSLPFSEQDWRGLSEADHESCLNLFLSDDRRRGFALNQAPLFRLALLRLGDEDWYLVWTFHHALLDGRSIVIVLREVFGRYQAALEGTDFVPPPSPAYDAYIRWLETRSPEGSLGWWRGQLGDLTQTTALPFPPRPEPGVFADQRQESADFMATAFVHQQMDQATKAGLDRVAGENGLTLNTMVQGAWALLLSRYSGQDDVVFGATKNVRHWPGGAETSVGVYINTLPVRAKFEPGMELIPWLEGLRRQWVAMREHEHTPLSRIHEVSGISASEPLFNTILVFEHASLEDLLAQGQEQWSKRHFEILERTPSFSLILGVAGGDNLNLSLEYDRRAMDGLFAARLLVHLCTLLRAMAEHPGSRLEDLPILSGQELRRLLLEWQPEPPAAPAPLAHRLFEARAGERPDAPAVEHVGRVVTYGELNARANALARRLAEMGAGPGTRVAVNLGRTPDLIAGLLAVLKAGAAYLPLDPAYPAERLEYMVRDSEAVLVLASVEAGEMAWARGLPVLLLGLDQDLGPDPGNPGVEPGPRDLAYVIYTSGTTGRPKGVMVGHEALAVFCQGAVETYGFSEADRVLQFATISFDAAVEEIFPTLAAGGTLVLRAEEVPASPAEFLDSCRRQGLTVLDLPTAYWHLLVSELDRGAVPESLRLVIIGGEAARADVLARWQEIVPQNVRLLNTYGPTEATVVSAWTDLTALEIHGDVPIGRPMPHVRAYVLDRGFRPVPMDVPGELFLSGPQLALGYLGREDLTAERFVSVSRIRATGVDLPGGLMYGTGDRVRVRSDGQLVYMGRYDRQVKIRGFRVELDEIETVLAAHPGVDAAVALALPDPEGHLNLAAYLVPAHGTDGKGLKVQVQGWVEERLPAYMRPSWMGVVERLPLTPAGKVDHRALPAPSWTAGDGEAAPVAAMDSLQAQLAVIWDQVLGVRPLSLESSFFDLGGNSLSVVKLLSHIEKQFGRSLPPMAVYKAPALGDMAAVLKEKGFASQWRSLEPVRPGGSRPPIFFVGSSNLLPSLARALGPDQPLYCLNTFGLQPLDGSVPNLDVPGIAKRYIREIRTVQAKGPYHLGGYCVDAKVAFEMARQLAEQGEAVGLLAFVDTIWQQGGQPSVHISFFRRHLRNLVRYGPDYLGDKLRQRYNLFKLDWSLRLARRTRSLYLLLGIPLPPGLRHKLFINAWYEALDVFEMAPYPGRISLFLSSEWRSRYTPDLERFACQGVDMTVIEAYHDQLFEHPGVNELAREMRRAMDEQPEGDCAWED